MQAGVPVRHVEEVTGSGAPKTVPMYVTNVPTQAVGPFGGPMVVSMRPMTAAQAKQATAVTSKYPRVHGR